LSCVSGGLGAGLVSVPGVATAARRAAPSTRSAVSQKSLVPCVLLMACPPPGPPDAASVRRDPQPRVSVVHEVTHAALTPLTPLRLGGSADRLVTVGDQDETIQTVRDADART